MRIASFLILFVLISCNTTKFHTMDDANDMTARLRGKVKSMEMTSFVIVNNDTVDGKIKRNYYFDKKNLLKEQYSSGKVSDETVYKYNSKGLIESSITKDISDSKFAKSEFEYDKKKNCISIKYFGNDTLRAIKTSKYDHKNNVIEEEFNNLQNEKYRWRQAFIYDYKKRICLLKGFDANNKEKSSILEFHYDKSGNIIKINQINSKNNINTYISIDYDRFGNSISYLSLDHKKNIKTNNSIKNEYDRKGNLIKSETFGNGKLIDISIFDIAYW
jgi:hypothetical protein